jgi:2-haloacid dehalogenase
MRQSRPPIEAVAFDLLTALVDSWRLWADVAGSDDLGRAWRIASLRRVTTAGDYVAYEDLVAEAGLEAGVPERLAQDLLARWGELRPWPEAPGVLASLGRMRLTVVTNCSQRLAEVAAARTGGTFEQIVSAERAGAYKTDPRAYRAALSLLDLPPERVLFVAGSAHDVPGASAVGLRVYWSNRSRLDVPSGAPPLVEAHDLTALPSLLAELMCGRGGRA